ncbi:MAG: hypothetical protein AABY16_03875 [Nanoarchaeota archaeon]
MSKHAFWQALIFTVIVFSSGLILGFFLESVQSDDIFFRLVDSEINILDEQLRQRILTDANVSCALAKESLFSFADEIYDEALELEEVDGTGRLGDLTILHRRYDLLRILLWIEAENMKERCKDDFHIVTYLYLYNNEDIDVSSLQNYFSRLVFDLKTEHPKEIVLIPVAVDTNVESVEVIVRSRDIGTFPVIIVDGSEIVSELLTFEELENLIFGNNNSSVSAP